MIDLTKWQKSHFQWQVSKNLHIISHFTKRRRVGVKRLLPSHNKREREKKERKIDNIFSSLYISLSGYPLAFPSRASYSSFDNSISNSLCFFLSPKKKIFILNKIKQKNNPSLSVLQRPDTSLLHTEVFFASLIILVSVLQKRYGC
jgi:hypothetical protein